MNYRAVFKCIAGCPGEFDLEQPIYRCPTCGDLLEVSHDLDALRQHTAAEWKTAFDHRYKRTEWPYGSAVWGKKEWVCPGVRNENIVSMDEGGTHRIAGRVRRRRRNSDDRDPAPRKGFHGAAGATARQRCARALARYRLRRL